MICETLTYLNLAYYLAYLLCVFETQTASLAKVIAKEKLSSVAARHFLIKHFRQFLINRFGQLHWPTTFIVS